MAAATSGGMRNTTYKAAVLGVLAISAGCVADDTVVDPGTADGVGLEGTYDLMDGNEVVSTLTVVAGGDFYATTRGGSSGEIGAISGKPTTREELQATYKQGRCTITFGRVSSDESDTLFVDQTGRCGLPSGQTLDGEYQRRAALTAGKYERSTGDGTISLELLSGSSTAQGLILSAMFARPRTFFDFNGQFRTSYTTGEREYLGGGGCEVTIADAPRGVTLTQRSSSVSCGFDPAIRLDGFYEQLGGPSDEY